MIVLGLMSLCHEGHGHSQHPSALLDGTLDIVWVVYEGSDNPGPLNLLTLHLKQEPGGSQALGGQGVWAVTMARQKAFASISNFVFEIFHLSHGIP